LSGSEKAGFGFGFGFSFSLWALGFGMEVNLSLCGIFELPLQPNAHLVFILAIRSTEEDERGFF